MGHKLVLVVICVHLEDLVRAVSVRFFISLLRAKVEVAKGKTIKSATLWLISVGDIERVLVVWQVLRQDARAPLVTVRLVIYKLIHVQFLLEGVE